MNERFGRVKERDKKRKRKREEKEEKIGRMGIE